MSCSIGKGIADFGNDVTNQPSVTFGESRQLLKGQYASPIVDPWDDRGPIIIAFEYIDNAPHLAMRPEDGSPGCDTGVAYSSVVRDKLPDRTQLVSYRGPAEPNTKGTEPLVFVDHNCNEYGQPIVGGALPDLLYSDPPGYLSKVVINPEGDSVDQYWVIDPWNATSRVLGTNVTWSSFDKEQRLVAFVDNGHLRMFDSHQQLTADLGTSITEVQFISNWSGALYTVDAGVLRRYSSTSDTAPIELARDACQISLDGSSAIYFYSPCGERKLQHYHLETGQVTTIDSGISGVVSTRSKSGSADGYILYTKAGDSGGQDLWLYSPDAAPSLVLSKFSRMYDWTPPPSLDVLAMVNADSTQGNIIRHNAAGDETILEAVSTNFSDGVLAHFDASKSVGDLYYPIQLGSTPQLAAVGVPYVDHVHSVLTPNAEVTPDLVPYGSAVITNATDGVGELKLMRMPSPTSPGPAEPVTLATGFPIGRIVLFEQMTAIGYLENWNKDLGGRLAVQELSLGALTNISDEVTDFQEVKWPSPGVMYVINHGDRAGIWVAKAKK